MTNLDWTLADHHHMAEAISLAKRGLYTTDPNPRVGCVLVKAGKVVGKGWHVRAGEGHAEVNAIADAGPESKGSTAYVTLEPCSHFGRTPPCAKGLIEAGVKRVVAAMEDPNPLVTGRGLTMLREAGIDVSVGLLQSAAEDLNPGFIKRMRSGQPFVRVKMAISVDGRTAMASGESQWITGSQARSDVQRLRARSSAIVSGINTVLEDEASLTVRTAELGLANADDIASRQSLRVILDASAKLPASAKLFASAGPILWVVADDVVLDANIESKANLDILKLPRDVLAKRDLNPVWRALAERDCNEVLVEAGATLAGSVLSQGACDELVVYMAPKLMGNRARGLAELPFDKMDEALALNLTDMRMVGDDIRLIYQPVQS